MLNYLGWVVIALTAALLPHCKCGAQQGADEIKPNSTGNAKGALLSEKEIAGEFKVQSDLHRALVARAKQLLKHFEQNRVSDKAAAKSVKFSKKKEIQLNMFELKDPDTLKIRTILSGVDIDRMTPVEALLKLQEIKGALFDEQ